MKKLFAVSALLGLFGCEGRGALSAANPPIKSESKLLGTWREGFKAGYAKALSFTSFDELYDWAEAGVSDVVLPVRQSRSTDLAGGRHIYIDTTAAGMKDARVSVYQEMKFIGNHNSGGTQHFFKMTQEWIQQQKPDEIIPPGHF